MDGMDATNLTALGIIALWNGWLMSKGLPMLRDYLAKRDEMFLQQITVAREEMSEQRRVSQELARGGHDAVNGMSSAIGELTTEIRTLKQQQSPPHPQAAGT